MTAADISRNNANIWNFKNSDYRGKMIQDSMKPGPISPLQAVMSAYSPNGLLHPRHGADLPFLSNPYLPSLGMPACSSSLFFGKGAASPSHMLSSIYDRNPFGPQPHDIPPKAIIETDNNEPDDPQVDLDNKELWEQFHRITTEMVITKTGR